MKTKIIDQKCIYLSGMTCLTVSGISCHD